MSQPAQLADSDPKRTRAASSAPAAAQWLTHPPAAAAVDPLEAFLEGLYQRCERRAQGQL